MIWEIEYLPGICALLYQLGATANYTGFFYTAHAVQLCVEQPQRLTLVTKWVYPDVAKQYGTNWKSVERNIRTIANIVWELNRSKLEQLAERKLEAKPCNAQLLSILTYALLSPHRSGPLPIHGLCESVALTGEDDDVGMVDEPVNESSSEPVIPKDRVPLAEFQI